MKKCPLCAEEIQDEAILCRYCGSELEDLKITNEQASYDLLEVQLKEFFSAMNQRDSAELRNYPFKSNRRHNVILRFVKDFETEDKDYILKANYALLGIYWTLGTNPKNKESTDDTVRGLIKIDKSSPIYPTEDEILLGAAIIINRGIDSGRVDPDYYPGYINDWLSWNKADRAWRFIRGFNLGGALVNLLSSPNRLPKENTVKWHVCRRAYAQSEAKIILSL